MREIVALAPNGSDLWVAAACGLALVISRLGRVDEAAALAGSVAALLEQADRGHPSGRAVVAACRLTPAMIVAGQRDLGERLLRAANELHAGAGKDDPVLSAQIQRARAYAALCGGDLGAVVTRSREAAALFESAGDLRSACEQDANHAYGLLIVGELPAAEEALRAARAAAARLGLSTLVALCDVNLGFVLGRRGSFDEACARERQGIEALAAQGDARLEGGARIYLAGILLDAGQQSAAEAEARAALDCLAAIRPLRVHALAVLACALLSQGRAEEALAAAQESVNLLAALGDVEEGAELARLAYAEGLHATGREEAARTAIAAARTELLARAEKISAPALRASFLEKVPENARTLDLARAWAGEA
jgi:hypothetical protein